MNPSANASFEPYVGPTFSPEAALHRAQQFRHYMEQRRSQRLFSEAPVSKALIEEVILTASTAPSGAHKQPWTFAAVSCPDAKHQIRLAAEREEYQNYHGRMSDEWLQDLQVFGTDWNKPYLEAAPWLIVAFKQVYGLGPNGETTKHYYVNESVGIAVGLLIAAIHHAGLVTLTHTPSPMDFLGEILERPANERAFLLLPVGWPHPDAQVPVLHRKTADQVIDWHEPRSAPLGRPEVELPMR